MGGYLVWTRKPHAPCALLALLGGRVVKAELEVTYGPLLGSLTNRPLTSCPAGRSPIDRGESLHRTGRGRIEENDIGYRRGGVRQLDSVAHCPLPNTKHGKPYRSDTILIVTRARLPSFPSCPGSWTPEIADMKAFVLSTAIALSAATRLPVAMHRAPVVVKRAALRMEEPFGEAPLKPAACGPLGRMAVLGAAFRAGE